MHFISGNKYNNSHKYQGFTLIEVLIALAIFSIGFLAVGSMQLRSTGGSTNARIRTEASIWTQDRVETLMSLPYDDPLLALGDVASNTEHEAAADDPSTRDNYNVIWEVWDDTSGAAPNTLIIRVTATGRGNRSSTVTFVRAQDV